MPNKIKDLSNQKFGRLTVIERAPNINGRAAWLCKCDCGGTKIVRSQYLQRGQTQSCGCKHKEQLDRLHNDNIVDITGQKFGKLTAIERVGSDNNNNTTWLCKCECGGSKVVSSFTLRNGTTQSCGCLKSKNEEKIARILIENGIPFEKEKIVNDPHSHEQYRFDFFIDGKYYLEYDGEQHFMVGSGWMTEEKLIYTREKDLKKNNYCFEQNVPLIRIPFDADYTFEDLVLETSKFQITKENEKKYYETH